MIGVSIPLVTLLGLLLGFESGENLDMPSVSLDEILELAPRHESDPWAQGKLIANAAMQCMAQCVKEEGADRKDMCKTRCSNVSIQAKPMTDCMQLFKSCLKTCERDKDCKSACRQAKQTCM